MKVLLTTVFVLALCLSIGAQTGTPSGANDVEWQAINGADGIFTVFVPQGYVASGRDRPYFLGDPASSAEVEKYVILARHINGALIAVEFYEGNGKRIAKTVIDRNKEVNSTTERVGDFSVTRSSKFEKSEYTDTQYFASSDGLYVLRAVRPRKDDPIVKSFFESVRIKSENAGLLLPNTPTGTKTTKLPRIVEVKPEILGDDQAIDSKDADRPPLLLSRPFPSFSLESRHGIASIRLKLKVLFSSSGKVTKVDVMESTIKSVNNEAIASAKRIVFLPAEKDGKLVSVYQTLEFSYWTTTF